MFANLQLVPCFSIFMHQICLFFFQKYFLCFYKLPIAIDSFCLSIKQLRILNGNHTIALPKKKQNLFFPKYQEFIFPSTAWQAVYLMDRDTLSHALHGLLQVDECTCLTYKPSALEKKIDDSSKNVSKPLFARLCFISFLHASPFPTRAL